MLNLVKLVFLDTQYQGRMLSALRKPEAFHSNDILIFGRKFNKGCIAEKVCFSQRVSS